MFNFRTQIFQHYIPSAFNSLTGTVRNLLCNLDISKITKKRSPPLGWERPEADLGAIWHRKRSNDAFSSIWDRFSVDFGKIINDFRLIFDVVFHDFDAILT